MAIAANSTLTIDIVLRTETAYEIKTRICHEFSKSQQTDILPKNANISETGCFIAKISRKIPPEYPPVVFDPTRQHIKLSTPYSKVYQPLTSHPCNK